MAVIFSTKRDATMTAVTETSASPRRKKQILPFILIFIGAVTILVGGLVLAIVIRAEQHPVAIPNSLAGVPLTAQVTGDEALTAIARLHGKRFPLVDGIMGMYGDNAAMIWASGTWLPIMAEKQVDAMTNRIAEGKSPFTPIETRKISGTTVYVLRWMGQLHFYFQYKQQVIWLAANTDIADAALTDLLAGLQ